MANPKRRHSKQRTRKKRTHLKAKAFAVSICPNCGKEKRPHRICQGCGYYKGRLVISVPAGKA